MIHYLILYLKQYIDIDFQKFDSLLKVLECKYRNIPHDLNYKELRLYYKFCKDEFIYVFSNYIRDGSDVVIPFLDDIGYLFYLEYVKMFRVVGSCIVNYHRIEQIYWQIRNILKGVMKKSEVYLMDIGYLSFCSSISFNDIKFPDQLRKGLLNFFLRYDRGSGGGYHIGIIMDGNRRFAQKNSLSESGHLYGAMTAFSIIKSCWLSSDVKELTLYTLSLDNMIKRDSEEIKLLYNLMVRFFKAISVLPIEICIIGNLDKLPFKVRKAVDQLMWRDLGNVKRFKVNLAIAYDSSGGEEDDNDYTIVKREVSDMDLVIRTGFVKRLSGFFPIETRYAELYFINKYWPEFTINDLYDVIDQFKKVGRRFGK